jgi:signal transduction histidine kinase
LLHSGHDVLGNVLEQVDMAVVLLDSDARGVLYSNRRAAELFVTAPAASVAAGVELLLAGGRPALEGRWGEPQTATLADRVLGYTPYRLPGDQVCLFFRDITFRSRTESLAAAASWVESLESLFAAIRHELANPLNAIKMTLSVLQHHRERFPAATVEDYLARAMGEVGKLERLLRALKTFGMLGAPRVRALPAAPFLVSLEESAAAVLLARGVELSVAAEPGLGELYADPIALRQVLANLLENAADASERSATHAIRIRARRTPELLFIEVDDDGEGIPMELQPRLFEPFFTTKPTGVGLGLVVARKLVVQMGGQISIASRRGVGTTVTLSLAAAPAPPP